MDTNMKTVLRSLVQHLQPGKWEIINIHALTAITDLTEDKVSEALVNLEARNVIERQLIEGQSDFRIKLDDNGHIIV